MRPCQAEKGGGRGGEGTEGRQCCSYSLVSWLSTARHAHSSNLANGLYVELTWFGSHTCGSGSGPECLPAFPSPPPPLAGFPFFGITCSGMTILWYDEPHPLQCGESAAPPVYLTRSQTNNGWERDCLLWAGSEETLTETAVYSLGAEIMAEKKDFQMTREVGNWISLILYSMYYKPMLYYKPTPLFSSDFGIQWM